MTTINFNFGHGEETASSKIQMTNETMPSPMTDDGVSLKTFDSQTIPSPSEAERFSSIENNNVNDPEEIQGAQGVDSSTVPSPLDEESGLSFANSEFRSPEPEDLEADAQEKGISKTIKSKSIKK